MRPDRVVVLPYALDGDVCIFQRVEYFAIQKLIAKLRVEALTSAALPEAEGCGLSGLGACGAEPVAQVLGNKLRAVSSLDFAPQPRMCVCVATH